MRTSERLFERLLSRLMRRGVLSVTYSGGEVRTYGAPDPELPEIAIRLTDPAVARDILRDPRLGLGESYMDGRLVVERGDVMQMVALLRAQRPWEEGRRLAAPSVPRRIASGATAFARSFNRPGSARRNVAHHYDIGNALYRLMLDPEHMQYSCAYWSREDMDLGQAQEAKLAHIAAKLALRPGLRVLDIGCGWGGMAIFLAQRAGVSVLGITLSREQLDLARQRAEEAGVADRVRFELLDYRELARSGEQFDRIVSVGMFEHVGRPQFETYFRACARMLADDGTMLLHTIGRMGRPGQTDSFTDKWIFPGGYIPALSETVAASERVRLIVTDVETLRLHYARTLREWYARIVANREAVVALHDERFFRLWTFYLAGAASAFESGGLCNYQIQYAKRRDALPLTRTYMEQAEAALLAR
ncbi:MAG: class I SAM-dependent methyltransferase [Porphyrobacter sp.]|nr:class I SAM-dependent methyltransferase [Porphyrobacter sp.]